MADEDLEDVLPDDADEPMTDERRQHYLERIVVLMDNAEHYTMMLHRVVHQMTYYVNGLKR